MYYLIKVTGNDAWEVIFQSAHENELLSLINFIGDTFKVGKPKQTKVYSGLQRFKVVNDAELKQFVHSAGNNHAA